MMTRVVLLAVMLFAAGAPAAEQQQELRVQLTVPDTAWTLAIDEVYRVSNEIWVIAVVSRDPRAVGLQVVCAKTDAVRVAAPALPVKYFVTGRTWAWQNEEPYVFLKDKKEIQPQLSGGTLLYRRANK
jgi:hypothetical protein